MVVCTEFFVWGIGDQDVTKRFSTFCSRSRFFCVYALFWFWSSWSWCLDNSMKKILWELIIISYLNLCDFSRVHSFAIPIKRRHRITCLKINGNSQWRFSHKNILLRSNKMLNVKSDFSFILHYSFKISKIWKIYTFYLKVWNYSK